MANRWQRLILAITFVASTSAFAAPSGASLSGHVKNSSGRPQMGVIVEVFTSAATDPVKAFTDARGFYKVSGLVPGNYFVKASATQFLPSLRENVSLQPGSAVVVNLTLNTLVEAFQLIPPQRLNSQAEDDWRWTLRSAANRPILRVLEDDGPLVVVSSSADGSDRTLKARVAFIAGSDGERFNTSDMTTAFNVEQSLFGTGTMQFKGNVGYNSGFANGVVRASYRQRLATGSNPEIAITARRFANPDSAMRHAALNALALTMSDNFAVGDLLEFNYGGELQAVQFRGRVMAMRPFGSVAAHLTPNTVLEYSYATSQPTTRQAKGFDSAPMDLTETNPRVSLIHGVPQLERSRHHEIALSRRVGKNSFQFAYFADRSVHPALNGVADVDAFADPTFDVLPDVYSSTFNYSGPTFATHGLRVVAERRFSDTVTGTVNYSYGGVLTATPGQSLADLDDSFFTNEKRHAITGKVAAMMPGAKTRLLASYKWTSGANAITPVDAFNASAGQSDPFLNIFIRQPLPGTSFLPGRMEALVDVKNLLSQGYVPMVGRDGRTLYLVQSARAIRGGVAFNF